MNLEHAKRMLAHLEAQERTQKRMKVLIMIIKELRAVLDDAKAAVLTAQIEMNDHGYTAKGRGMLDDTILLLAEVSARVQQLERELNDDDR